MDERYGIHGGLTALLRQGAPRLMIGVTIRLEQDDFSSQDFAYESVKGSGVFDADPAKSVVLCSLDERGATRLVRPDREALAKWLERYRGLGDIRSAGHAASVMTKVEPQ